MSGFFEYAHVEIGGERHFFKALQLLDIFLGRAVNVWRHSEQIGYTFFIEVKGKSKLFFFHAFMFLEPDFSSGVKKGSVTEVRFCNTPSIFLIK